MIRYALFMGRLSKHLPVASNTAILMASPLMMAVLAVLMYRQRMSLRRWLAVMVGFAGVLLVVQPSSEDFNTWSLIVLLAAFIAAFRDSLTPYVAKNLPTVQLAIISVGTIALSSTAGALARRFRRS